MAVRNKFREATPVRRPRKHLLNKRIIGGDIGEAREELNNLLMQIESGELGESELRLGLQHAYLHLNFAWNVRHVSTSRYASLTQEDFEQWAKYPSDLS